MTDEHELNDRARAWIDGILAQYETVDVDPEGAPDAAQLVEVGNFKIL
jgi:hypothetical protein